MANALLGRPDVDPTRQLEQIWRAAADDLGDDLENSYRHQALWEGCRIAALGLLPAEAVGVFDDYVTRSRAAGLPIDLARRALARTSATDGGAETFTAELFSEATAYYAARDLPSFVGAPGRLESVSDAVALKRAMRDRASALVARVGPPPAAVAEWQAYAREVISHLRGDAR